MLSIIKILNLPKAVDPLPAIRQTIYQTVCQTLCYGTISTDFFTHYYNISFIFDNTVWVWQTARQTIRQTVHSGTTGQGLMCVLRTFEKHTKNISLKLDIKPYQIQSLPKESW